jgi:hypothetical protein
LDAELASISQAEDIHYSSAQKVAGSWSLKPFHVLFLPPVAIGFYPEA